MDSLLKSRFISLYKMVLADGIIDPCELQTLHRIGSERYGITSEQIGTILRDSNLSDSIPESIPQRISLLYQLAEIAWADGKIEDTERQLMIKYARKMGFEEENLIEITNYILSEVERGTTEQELISQVL